MLPDFYTVQTNDFDINQLQDSLTKALKPVFDNDLLGGVLLPRVSLTLGQNYVNHKLGRVLTGWILVRQRAQAQIWDTQDTNSSAVINLSLNTSAAVVVDLYVF